MPTLLDTALPGALAQTKPGERLLACLQSQAMDGLLEMLLTAMSWAVRLNWRGFGKNARGFNATYVFRSQDGQIAVSVIFEGGGMRVLHHALDTADLTVSFKDARALWNYITSQNPDILGSVLRQDVVPDGNLNYLFKFGYMAKRLQLMLQGEV